MAPAPLMKAAFNPCRACFPGGALIGCSAGFVNVPRIKGSHNAMKTGMMAAEQAFAALNGDNPVKELSGYEETFEKSWVYKDLHRVRNAKPAIHKYGAFWGTLYAGFDMWLNNIGLGFLIPWTFGHDKDNECLKPAAECEKINYAKPDGTITFDKLSSVFISNTNHAENQPCHLTLKDDAVPVNINYTIYAGPKRAFARRGFMNF